MKKLATALLTTFALALAPDGSAIAAPPGIKDKKIDIDLKQASIADVFRVLARFSERPIVLDPCVTGELDLRLKNTPIPLVFDALASQMKLVYDDNADNIYVRCQETAAIHAGWDHVSLAEADAPLPDVLDRLATSAKLTGVDYMTTKRPPVTMTPKDVRLSTAMTALGDSTGLRVRVRNNRLVVADGS